MLAKRSLLIVALVGVLTLTGSQCLFVASSGNNNDCKVSISNTCDSTRNNPSGTTAVLDTGLLIDAPVQGARYESGTVSGLTDARGQFRYEPGGTVRFFIGDIALGKAVKGKAVITPLDLVPDGTIDTPAVINMARLLQSLDGIPGDHIITIPAALHSAAVRSNASVSAAIQYLDFADDTAFVNSATQLISTLTASYPHTAVLLDAATAKDQLARSLREASIAAATPTGDRHP
jgi:hypothetical protein